MRNSLQQLNIAHLSAMRESASAARFSYDAEAALAHRQSEFAESEAAAAQAARWRPVLVDRGVLTCPRLSLSRSRQDTWHHGTPTLRPASHHTAVVGPDLTPALQYLERHAGQLHRRSALRETWNSWCLRVTVARLRAELETALASDLQVQRESRDKAQDLQVGQENAEVVTSLKRLVLEFRHRMAAALVDLAPSSDDALPMLVGALDRGRRSFGRFLHAALFLYQKLRALVPSELLEPLQDPLCKLVPLPFYVLPYKVQHALKHGLAAAVRGTRPVAVPSTRSDEEQLSLFEERLPLAAGSSIEVPTFLLSILRFRAQLASKANKDAPVAPDPSSGTPLRDRVDVLIVDALTVYMSAWRSGLRELALQR